MVGDITIRTRGDRYQVKMPVRGYTSEIHVATMHQRVEPRGFTIWDNGSAYDYRLCDARFMLDPTEALRLLDAFADADKGRGLTVSIDLPASSGFFMFGPDRGDTGTFGARITRLRDAGLQEEPWQYFSVEVSMVATSLPAYVLPSQVAEGDLQIGTITNLRYPPMFPTPAVDFKFETVLTRDGSPYTIDKTSASDSETTQLSMVCNESKAAALINHLVNTVRDNTLSIVAGSGNYLWGRKAGASGTYTCYWLDEVISVSHDRHDEFRFNLSFWRSATA
jgi:hypothetical protein